MPVKPLMIVFLLLPVSLIQRTGKVSLVTPNGRSPVLRRCARAKWRFTSGLRSRFSRLSRAVFVVLMVKFQRLIGVLTLSVLKTGFRRRE